MHTLFRQSVLAASLLLATAAYAATSIEDLPGYDAKKVVAGFSEYLESRPKLIEELAARPDAAQKVFADSVLQRQLMVGRPLSVVVPEPRDTSKKATPDNRLAVRATSNVSSRAQQELARVTAVQKAAQEDPELQDKLLSGEFDGELAREGNSVDEIIAIIKEQPLPVAAETTQPPAAEVVANEPYSVADINAIPSAASAAPDANGWPQYLKAPSDCAAPQQGMQYIHEFVLYDRLANNTVSPEGALPASGKNNMIMSYFYRGGNPFDVWMSDSEIISVPFIYDPAQVHAGDKSFGFFSSGKYRYTNHETVISLSDCPSDFGDGVANRLGEKNCVQLHGGDSASLSYGSGAVNNPYMCKLEPGKRYFLNFQIVYHAEDTPANHAQLDLSRNFCYYRKGGNWVCEGKARPDLNLTPRVDPACRGQRCEAGNIAIGSGGNKRLPYNGPCLQRGPYPLNYNNRTCGRSYGNQICANESAHTTECIDPAGELASVRLVQGCQPNGRQQWLEGYGKPLHIRMQCGGVGGGVAMEFIQGRTYRRISSGGGSGSGNGGGGSFDPAPLPQPGTRMQMTPMGWLPTSAENCPACPNINEFSLIANANGQGGQYIRNSDLPAGYDGTTSITPYGAQREDANGNRIVELVPYQENMVTPAVNINFAEQPGYASTQATPKIAPPNAPPPAPPVIPTPSPLDPIFTPLQPEFIPLEPVPAGGSSGGGVFCTLGNGGICFDANGNPVPAPPAQTPVPDPQPDPEEENDTPPTTPTPPSGGGGGGGGGSGGGGFNPFGPPGGNQQLQDMIDEINRRNNTNPY